jgi:hypothetical protein
VQAGDGVICVDNLDTGSVRNIEHIRDDAFVFVNRDMIDHLEIDEPTDFVYHPASPASPSTTCACLCTRSRSVRTALIMLWGWPSTSGRAFFSPPRARSMGTRRSTRRRKLIGET